MRRAIVILGLAVFLAISGLWPTSDARAESPTRPNMVVIFIDDLGYGELGCQGNPEIPTPHIDSIASAGVRFTDGYVTAPYCSASRAGIMTGRYQTRFGHEFNPVGHFNEDPDAGLPLSERTLADYLGQAGYATGLVGKWHLGGHAKFHPLRRGFDEFFGFLHEGHFFVPPPYEGATTMLRRRALPGGGEGRWMSEDGRTVLTTHMRHKEPAYDANNPILRDGQPVNEPDYFTDAIARESVAYIERNKERPFLLFTSFNAVHSPLQATDKYMDRFSHIDDIQRRIFAAMLSAADDAVGEILETLRKHDLEEQTLVFFISDNGGPTRELTSSNAPLRGGKGDLYEGGVRVPFLAQWPGTLPAGKEFTSPVVSLDVMATALAVSGLEASKLPGRGDQPLDGVNLLPYLTGEVDEPPHPTLFWRMGQKRALRQGDWKIVRPGPASDGTAKAHDGWELYDLANDIAESRDLGSERPEVLRELIDAWQSLNQEMVEPVWQR